MGDKTTAISPAPLVMLTGYIGKAREYGYKIVETITGDIGKLAISIKADSRDIITKSQAILTDISLLKISDDEELIAANEYLTQLVPCIKKAKEYQDSITKPIKQHTKDIDTTFKQIIDALTTASDLLRRKTVQYRQQEQEANKTIASILAESPTQDQSPPPALPAVSEQKSIRLDTGSVSYTPVWEFEIQDSTQIPLDILHAAISTPRGKEALESIIRSRIKSGIRNIPGVRIYQTEQTRVTK